MLVATGAALFAGCTSNADSDRGSPTATDAATTAPTATQTGTPTATQTQDATTTTATPTPQPSVQTFEPVTKALTFADGETIADHTTPAFGRGGEPFVAQQVSIPVHGNAAKLNYRVTISRDGTQIDSYESDSITEAVTDGDRYTDQYWVGFGQSDWDLGTYTATLDVTDEITDETATATTTFEMRPPFREREVYMTDTDLPEHATVGEQLSYALTFDNRSDRASSLVTPVSLKQGHNSWMKLDTTLTVNIPAGATQHFEASFTPKSSGRFELRLDKLNQQFGWDIEQ